MDTCTLRSVCLIYVVWYMYLLYYRPAQHGADLLSLLSDILNTHGGESGAAACGLALEALGHLCQAEVRCPYIKCVCVCLSVCLALEALGHLCQAEVRRRVAHALVLT